MGRSGQLSLNLTPCLAYSAKSFVQHKGVKDISSQIIALLETQPPKFSFVYSPKRFGKTHFSIALSDRLVSRGLRPVLLDGQEFKQVVLSEERNFFEKETLVVDDSEVFLDSVMPGNSGPLVKFFEELRVKEIGLVLFSSKKIADFPCDEHVMSRLRGCAQMEISAPDADSLQLVVESMAKQRGLALGGRRLSFLEKRVSRSIPEIECYLERLGHLQQLLGRKISFKTLGDAFRPVKSIVF